ncbi:MAG: hydantoinase B/oxoprolinase family protein, partial [Pseudomonadota bacterium]
VMAASFDALWDTQVYGTRPDGGRFAYVWFAAGGCGAIKGRDGLSATAFPSGIAGVQSEMIEALVPIHIAKRELVTDSGGAGQWRGGLAQAFSISVDGEDGYIFSGLYDRIHYAAEGLEGGKAGATGTIATRSGNPLKAKTRNWLQTDEEVTLTLPGGGGYGPALERDPALVAQDVLNGYVSIKGAREDYAVVVDPHTFTVDHNATDKLRHPK